MIREAERTGARVYAAPVIFPGRPRDIGGQAGVLRGGAIALDGDVVLDVGPRAEVETRHGPAEWLDAVVLPALVNAHTHLELSHLRGRIVGGDGLAAWVGRLVAARAAERQAPRAGRGEPPEALGALLEAIDDLQRAGVAAVGEVTNTLAALPYLSRAGLVGTVFHEVFGYSPGRIATALAAAAETRRLAPAAGPWLRVCPSPHAVYSTNPRVLAELLRAGPASIHLAEDPAERLFCAEAAGPFAAMNRALGARELPRLGRSAVAVVAPHLGPGSLVVHAVDLDAADLAALACSRATVVLCPRSNLHIGGRVAELPALLASGIPLAVGTDSLASSPSLSPLAELAVLARAFPDVDSDRLLPLAWNGPAVGAPAVGRLTAGTAPGVLAAPLDRFDPPDPARWMIEAYGAAEQPFRWLARPRPEGGA